MMKRILKCMLQIHESHMHSSFSSISILKHERLPIRCVLTIFEPIDNNNGHIMSISHYLSSAFVQSYNSIYILKETKYRLHVTWVMLIALYYAAMIQFLFMPWEDFANYFHI